MSFDEARRVVESTDAAIEIVQCGNVRRAAQVAGYLKDRGELHRLILGNDAPSGTGVVTLGILRNISWVISLAGIDADVAVCAATGNTARLYVSRVQYQDFAIHYDAHNLWWQPHRGGRPSRYRYQIRDGRMILQDEEGNLLLMRQRR